MKQISILLIIILLVPFLGSAILWPSGFFRPVKAQGAENGLVAYWNFDEGSGTVAHDSSGNGNDGILCNGPTWVNGKNGTALSFNGVDDYVNITENTDLNPHMSNWTVSAWLNIAQLSRVWDGYGFVIVGKRQTEYDQSLILLAFGGASATSQARFGFVFDGHCQLAGGQSALMNVFGWHNVVGVRRGGDLYVYVDGIEYGPNNYAYCGSQLTTNTDVSSSTPINLAHHGAWGCYYNGTIDEVRIYNRALTQQEILADMAPRVFPSILAIQNNETRFWYMDYALNRLAIPHTNIVVSDLPTTNLSDYQVILFGSLLGLLNDVKPSLDARANDIAAWVADGGSLFVEGQIAWGHTIDLNGNDVPSPGSGYYGWVPGNPDFKSDQFGDAVHIVCPTHPLVENLTDASLTGWNTAPNGYFDSYTGQGIAVQSGYSDRTALFVYGLGKGTVTCSCLNSDVHTYGNGRGSDGQNDAETFIEDVVNYCSHVLGPRFNVSINPLNATTSIDGTATFDLAIENYGDTPDTLTLNVQGVDSSWYSLSKNNFTMIPGDTEHVELGIAVPEDPINVGAHSFNITVSGVLTEENVNATLNVVQNPLIYSLEPDNDTILGTTSLLVSWMTSSNASSEIYIKRVGDLVFDHIVGDSGKSHYVYANNLSRNTDYLWYAYSETAYGNVSSDTKTLHTSNGISFTQRSYTFNVQRDYAQYASVSVTNNDTQSHDLLLEALNPYQDLIVGFVGPGSVDENLTVASGETISVAFNIFAQDAMQQNYTFLVKLTNLGAEQITDYALVNVNVRQPNINLTLVEGSTDPITLSKTITATNYGDPITDLYIDTSDDLVGKVSFEPTVCHDDLPTGGSLTFQIVPVLTTDFTGIEGNITATGAGQVIATLPVNFTLPPGTSVYSVTIPQVSIGFDNYYDTDDSPNTNPLPSQPVESYLANGTLIFAGQIIVDVYQNDTPAHGANVSLTVWDETGTVWSTEYSETDFTGKAMFVVYGQAGNYSYQAELVGYGIDTEKRSFSVDTHPLFEIHSGDITWLNVSDANSTFDLSQNASWISLDQAPFTFRARKTTIDQNATFTLCLKWNIDKFKKIFIPGSVLNDTITFETSSIPLGNFSAVVVCYSNSSGLSLSTPINITNTDWSAMYLQGNYTYWQPFPLNSTHFIRLSIYRLVSSRDPSMVFDLQGIQPAGNNLLYNLTYLIESNGTANTDFRICAEASNSILYNSTFDFALEPWKPYLVSFTIPAYSENGTLLSEFNATISSGSLFVTIIVQASINYIYDSRIWVGADSGASEIYLSSSPSPQNSIGSRGHLWNRNSHGHHWHRNSL